MNNKERLASHYRMYEWLKEQAKKNNYPGDNEDSNDWDILENRYPELLTFIEDLISDVEELTNQIPK